MLPGEPKGGLAHPRAGRHRHGLVVGHLGLRGAGAAEDAVREARLPAQRRVWIAEGADERISPIRLPLLICVPVGVAIEIGEGPLDDEEHVLGHLALREDLVAHSHGDLVRTFVDEAHLDAAHLVEAREERVHDQHRLVDLLEQLNLQATGQRGQHLHVHRAGAAPDLRGLVLEPAPDACGHGCVDLVLAKVSAKHHTLLQSLAVQVAELRHCSCEAAHEGGEGHQRKQHCTHRVCALERVAGHHLHRSGSELRQGPVE
mmetsp:Transcript_84534/g.223961  ORF Transcript_84534/g.223961 Transcript_84534/m.223961 type:complete len:259 (-) Transcript_84534:226-1002(-)